MEAFCCPNSKMLTKREFQILTKVFQICCFVHCLPLDWDNVNSRLLETKSRVKLIFSRICLVWRALYAVAVVLRLHPLTTWSDCDRDIVKQIFHMVMIVCYVNVASETATLHYYSREASLLFNQLMLFNQNTG